VIFFLALPSSVWQGSFHPSSIRVELFKETAFIMVSLYYQQFIELSFLISGPFCRRPIFNRLTFFFLAYYCFLERVVVST